MKTIRDHTAPDDAETRRAVAPVVCYPIDTLPPFDIAFYDGVRRDMALIDSVTVNPRDAAAFNVPAGHVFRISLPDGSQVGDLNLWNAKDHDERFFSGKTRALHGTHVSTGDKLWSNLPYMRPMATIIRDTLDWYGYDSFGGGIHDVIGTRCDPYTNMVLNHEEYHYCCHSNLTRAFADATGRILSKAEPFVHDVLNVFMCTGFTSDTKQYFMKASPARKGDCIEFFAEIDLLGALSACPGGDCGSSHSSEEAQCYPMLVEIFKPAETALSGWQSSPVNAYSRSHGRGGRDV